MLTKTILEKAVKNTNELGWKLSDIPLVAQDALKNNLAILGGQVQYILPGATCELYWVSADPEIKKTGTWEEYVKLSHDVFIKKFSENVLSRDIKKEAVESFNILKQKDQEGVNIDDYQIFVMYFKEPRGV